MPGMPNFGGGAGGMPNFGGAGGMPGGMNFEDLGDEGEGAGECTAALMQLLRGYICMRLGCTVVPLPGRQPLCSVLLDGVVQWRSKPERRCW